MLAALVVVSYALAHVLGGDAEVRISARVLDDGRTEFALQQRSDGEWGDRVLPRARFFPAEAEQDQWLNSTPLSIETAGHESDDMLDEELRSAKEELAATQQAIADAQKFVGVDIEELIAELEDTQAEANESHEETQAELKAATESLEEANTELAKYTAPILREPGTSEYDQSRITTRVAVTEYDQSGVEVIDTTVKVFEGGDHKFGDRPTELLISCTNGSLRLFLGPLPLVPGKDRWDNDVYTFAYALTGDLGDHSNIATGSQTRFSYDARIFSAFDGQTGRVIDLPSHVAVALRSADSLEVTLTGTDDESYTTTFTLQGLFDTPAQPNIDRCGQYY